MAVARGRFNCADGGGAIGVRSEGEAARTGIGAMAIAVEQDYDCRTRRARSAGIVDAKHLDQTTVSDRARLGESAFAESHRREEFELASQEVLDK